MTRYGSSRDIALEGQAELLSHPCLLLPLYGERAELTNSTFTGRRYPLPNSDKVDRLGHALAVRIASVQSRRGAADYFKNGGCESEREEEEREGSVKQGDVY